VTPSPTRRPVVPPGDDTEAPGSLGVIEALVNTITLDASGGGGEQLGDRDAATAWLRRYGLLAGDEAVATDDEVARLVRLREGLRDVLSANHDDVPPPPEALAVLDDEAQRVAVTMRFTPSGSTLEPAGSGTDAAIAALLTVVLDAMRDGSWRRLKACRSATCRWAFWDASRNRSSKWCDMAVCGNRQKVRSYRERHGDR
jgi:predicted RNA-binding Zn ribbon-like protein